MTISIMIDLETWGTEPGCDIRSIGAVVFDPLTGKIPCYNPNAPTGEKIRSLDGTFYIACDNPSAPMIDASPGYSGYYDGVDTYRKYPLTRDPRTVQWWSEQSDEAQAAFADPVDLREALVRFSNWLCDISENPYVPSQGLTNIRIWSHGAATDGPWLAAAYRACGLPVPWHYRAPRDTRTIFDAAGIDDHSAWLKQYPGPLGIPHHAADDAICQARAVCAAFEIIGTWRNAHEECERDL